MKSQLDLSFSAKEKVNHKVGTNLRMFINRLHSDFPPHWHTDIEIIIPKEAPYRVVCGNQAYDVEIDDILMICPAVLHEIFSPTPGARVYIQADFSGIITLKEIEKAFRLMSPALHIKKKSCPTDVYDRLCKYIDEIMKLYFGSALQKQLVNESSFAVVNVCDNSYVSEIFSCTQISYLFFFKNIFLEHLTDLL